jgi:N-acyl-D-aspartate/D-glutamate deacylase
MIHKIINAMIVDGTGDKPFLGGLEIREGKISRVFRGPSRDTGEDVIDAKGMVLCPGFIDKIAVINDKSIADRTATAPCESAIKIIGVFLCTGGGISINRVSPPIYR